MAWREIPESDLPAWNGRLLETTASLRQYPFFNDGLRRAGGLWVTTGRRFAAAIAEARRWTTAPRFLARETPQGGTFACIVTIGVPGFKVGCILDGPIALHDGQVDKAAIRELIEWARDNNYIALRVTHSSEDFLAALADMGTSERIDGVPFYPHPSSELYIDLLPDASAISAGFQAVARRNIRQAREAGYSVTIDTEPEAMVKAWPAFRSRSAQKGISYRDLDTYKRMMSAAKPHGTAHLYTAWRQEIPIAAILILRDRTTAHYFLGTIDVDALGDAPSPACLLHWDAMQEAKERGASFYNLGTRSGPVYTFKAKFRPVEHDHPAPLTLVIKPALYRLWRRLLPSLAQAVQ